VITAIDTNILLDILIPEPAFQIPSKEALEKALIQGRLLVGEIVYAELAVHFPTAEMLQQFLRETGIALVASTPAALEEAAVRWKRYLKDKARDIVCPKCGHPRQCSCLQCGESLEFRQRILADFIIGGQALIQADGLLTRDRGFYRKYFKELRLM
jgi:predicted nucleic acid-binding protein